MKPLTKVRMIRLREGWSSESIEKWNIWNIGDLGYIEGVIAINARLLLVIVLGNKIISCYTDAVEVIKD